MRAPVLRIEYFLFIALSAVGLAAASGCNADVETTCYGGPCEGTGGAPATTSSPGGGGAGGSGGSGGAAACVADGAKGDIPCEVHAVLQAKCQTCHNDNHDNGAPIDLLACERFHELDCGQLKTRADVARDYITSGFMPLGGGTLTADEKKTLLDWLDACAPCEAAGSACGDPPGAKACGG